MRKMLVAAGGAMLATSAFAQSGATPPKRSNLTGPTVEQLRAAPIDRPREGALPQSLKAGAVKTWTGGPKYELPDGVRVIFARCAADGRCDRAVLVAALGPDTPANREAAGDAVYAPNMLYGDRGMAGYFALIRPSDIDGIKGLALVRDYELVSDSKPDEINSDFDVFYDMLFRVRAALAKAGRAK